MLLENREEFVHMVVTHVLPGNVVNQYIIVTDNFAGYSKEFNEHIDRLWDRMGKGLGWYAIWDHTIREEFGIKESPRSCIFRCGNTSYIRRKE